MKRIIPFVIAIIAIVITSCKGGKNAADEQDTYTGDTMCCCPHTVIRLQPMDDFSQKEAKKLEEELQKHIYKLGLNDISHIEIMPNKKLVPSLLNDDKTRYRADKIIRYVQEGKNGERGSRITIALTHKDISVPLRGKKDWGVLGLSLQPGTACVVSTHRVKNKSQLWKVVVHEFCHTNYDLPHCPNDDPTCIMKDAKGHEVLSRKTHFCKACKAKLAYLEYL